MICQCLANMEDMGVHPSRCNPARKLWRWYCSWCNLEFVHSYYRPSGSPFVLPLGVWVSRRPKIPTPELRT